MTAYTLGIDVGGTFTDLVCADESGHLEIEKVLSTADNQALGVLAGIEKLASTYGVRSVDLLSHISVIVHGTTVATNTMLEYNGAHTGLITTAGFRDIIEIRRNYKEAAFDIRLPAPHPIVPRRRRLGVTERIDVAGTIVKPLVEDEVREAVRRLAAMEVEAIAVCYLFAFLNPVHELRTREIIRETLPDVYVALSSEVLPQVREFERLSTTLVDAYVTPRLRRYLQRLETDLRARGFRGELFIMQGNGGVVGVERASRHGVQALLSGPASGVVAGAHLGHRSGFKDVITIDMGGTSFDVCLVQDGRPKIGTDQWMSRYRVAVPFIDIHTIGAGGGSIAWVDEGGALRVGPESARAHPGPACYGFGGQVPTVTDADVVLGYVNPESFLGGEMRLNADAARHAILTKVAHPLGMDLLQAASGIFRIVNNVMSNSVRQVSLAKGYDPRDFALTAFGGAGAIHAGALVESLGIRTILVPKNTAPMLCALGDLLSDLRVSRVRSFHARSSTVDLTTLNALCHRMGSEAEEALGTQRSHLQGITTQLALAMRYVGQTHEVTVPIASRNGVVGTAEMTAAIHGFHTLHKQLFTFNKPEDEVEILSLQLDLIGIRRKPVLRTVPYQGIDPRAAFAGKRSVYSSLAQDFVETNIYDGNRLLAGNVVEGPAVIEEKATSIVIFPGQRAVLNEHLTYVIEVL
ncbi:MAG: hydantoinase/oxoprolinase family protein [Deltaproteobacteria bacterium]|nr:hydantoinase/oxoprolinase family protein [Deltaproteobacteria bacterium]